MATERKERSSDHQCFILQRRGQATGPSLVPATDKNSEHAEQLTALATQNAEMLRLLETEEARTSNLELENQHLRHELAALHDSYQHLQCASQSNDDIAQRSTAESQLRADQITTLRHEMQAMKKTQQGTCLRYKVEIETLEQQLTMWKEKCYQALGNLHAQDDVKKQATDEIVRLQGTMKQMRMETSNVTSELQRELHSRQLLEQRNHQLTADLGVLRLQIGSLQQQAKQMQAEEFRCRAEARESLDQLSELAYKTLQLLERLKLAERANGHARDSLNKREKLSIALNRRISKMVIEHVHECRTRAKIEMDLKVLQKQTCALREHNHMLAVNCRAAARLREATVDEKDKALQANKALARKLGIALNKIGDNAAAEVQHKQHTNCFKTRVQAAHVHGVRLKAHADRLHESNGILMNAMWTHKHDMTSPLSSRRATSSASLYAGENAHPATRLPSHYVSVSSMRCVPDLFRQASLFGGFYVDVSSAGCFTLKADSRQARRWLQTQNINGVLRRAQAGDNPVLMLVEHMAQSQISQMNAEKKISLLEAAAKHQREQEWMDPALHASKLQAVLQMTLDAKHRILRRYIDTVLKCHRLEAASEGSRALQQQSVDGNSRAQLHLRNVKLGSCVSTGASIVLPCSSLSDEDVYALAALLKGNSAVGTLLLAQNSITDNGAKALANLLTSSTPMRRLDLRNNYLSQDGIRCIASELEHSESIRHVIVHSDGRIDGVGQIGSSSNVVPSQACLSVICVVDCRANKPR
mmetsp:Transcript_21118/g.68070  ORF Transcript_21118/g.68070 Transcript_21118/m.68070 type:complete len:759 (-) Transcript_21118:919-3195(-)|eukprot:CAMPEP_0118915194 /NCGR_PEP_ID=MMETSP1166-20130328/15405_1 /TAXON_ID=1104430 /ORGANISM="Chrysoreinhardia sp, Strain CCMP3193" /LENGTH=758 /DNA_ID=CAMNT_0006854857 /DNA_START=210 /DNA_END=2486 /DNA_ORIENTATION=+